ncbi:MAG: pyruvate kinase [Acidimicrobiales bacterium]
MDVARLSFSFSHGGAEENVSAYALVREASDAAGRAVGVLADLQGPKIRLGLFEGGSAFLEAGSSFTVTTETSNGIGDTWDRGVRNCSGRWAVLSPSGHDCYTPSS